MRACGSTSQHLSCESGVAVAFKEERMCRPTGGRNPPHCHVHCADTVFAFEEGRGQSRARRGRCCCCSWRRRYYCFQLRGRRSCDYVPLLLRRGGFPGERLQLPPRRPVTDTHSRVTQSQFGGPERPDGATVPPVSLSGRQTGTRPVAASQICQDGAD